MVDLNLFQFSEIEAVGTVCCLSINFLFLNDFSTVQKNQSHYLSGSIILHTMQNKLGGLLQQSKRIFGI